MTVAILVGTSDGLWDANTGRRLHFEGREVASLVAADSSHWAIVDGGEVWRFDPNGMWSRVASVEGSRAHCIFQTARHLFVGASNANLFQLQDHELQPVRSLGTAEGRDEWYTPWGGPPDVRSIAGESSGMVFVNVHVGGILRSAEGSASWEPTIDIDTDVHQVLYDEGSGLLLAASAAGLATSTNRGESWHFQVEGLHATYLRAVAIVKDTVLVTASTGPSTQRGAVYRIPAAGADSFERCRHGLPNWFSDNIDTFCLSAVTSCAAFGTPDGQVFASSDRGEHWDLVADGLPRVLSVMVVENGETAR